MNKDIHEEIKELKEQMKIEQQEAVNKMEPTENTVEQPEVSEIEQKAIEMGWDPSHKGPNFVSAKEFVERGSFFRKIDSLNKKLEKQEQILQQLEQHNKRVAEASYKRGMEDALKQRKEAIQAGDTEQFEAAEREIKRLETDYKPVQQAPAQNNEITQDMISWAEENKSWFNNNTKENARMVKEADGLFMLESQENPTLSHKEILSLVKEKIQRLHPEHFENPNKQKPMMVTKTSGTTSTKSTGLANKLTPTQRKFFEDAKYMGSKLTIEDYAKQLDITGDLKND
jgi:hypothetical protein